MLACPSSTGLNQHATLLCSIKLERASSSRRVVEAAKRTLQKEAEEVRAPTAAAADHHQTNGWFGN